MNWDNITIEQLQELASIEHFEGVEKRVHQIAIIDRMDIDDVEAMSLKQILERVQALQFLNELPTGKAKAKFKHMGKRYKLILNAQAMNAHHFIELQQIKSEDIIGNLHKILAMLSHRVDVFGRRINISPGEVSSDYERKCEEFKFLPVSLAYSYASFFSALYPQLLTVTLDYLRREIANLAEKG